jgi:hypothetical protein
MILRWMQPDDPSRKRPTAAPAHADTGSATLSPPRKPAGKLSGRFPSASQQDYFDSSLLDPVLEPVPAARSSKEDMLDDMGESEFNAILEQVCDTVMPRKLAKPLAPHRMQSAGAHSKPVPQQDGVDIPWSAIFLKVCEETDHSLAEVLTQLREISLLHPNVAPAIARVTERLEHAKRVAMISQQFTHLRGKQGHTSSELLSLRQVVSDAITQRARWLHRRQVKARLGLLDAQVQVNPAALVSLVDELINWAGGLAQEIGFAVREQTQETPGAQLLVMARVSTASIEPAQWQNVGWYLWHQLAGGMGARSELQVTQDALSVTVDFPAPPTPEQVAQAAREAAAQTHGPDSVQDTDMSGIIAGCRALLITAQPAVQQAASEAMNALGLQLSTCASLQQARIMLGLSYVSADQPVATMPHAIVFDSSVDLPGMIELRTVLASRSSGGRMAYVELSDQVGSDFHVSHMGEMSTAHVSVEAIRQSLAPALVFELCKVI